MAEMVEDYSTGISLFGRREISSSVDEITAKNVLQVLNRVLPIHTANSSEIDYLYKYMRGAQPVLSRTKRVRPEICNRIVENHAVEIAQFTSSYFLGEPVTYVRRSGSDTTSEEVTQLNDWMYFEDKASHDKDLSMWMAICGVGYRMVLPDRDAGSDEDESPFELDTLDPRHVFIVYHSGFGHKRLMSVQEIVKLTDTDVLRRKYVVYTPSMYFEIENGAVVVAKPHSLGDIPVFEYRLNMARMGSFEPAIPLLDGINTIMSNRVDGLEQFVQSIMKFKNCDVDDGLMKDIRRLGAIVLKSANGMDADVEIIASELNQTQTQTLVDYLYDQVLTICGLPTTTKGGTSTSDTGAAVFLRDGWSQAEGRARDTELLFKRSERQFLKLVLRLAKESRPLNLSLAEVECKFTRRQHDNLLSKSQSLISMLEAGLAPEVAIATCGLFNDPMDVAQQSAEYLRKWDYHEMVDAEPEEQETSDGGDEE